MLSACKVGVEYDGYNYTYNGYKFWVTMESKKYLKTKTFARINNHLISSLFANPCLAPV